MEFSFLLVWLNECWNPQASSGSGGGKYRNARASHLSLALTCVQVSRRLQLGDGGNTLNGFLEIPHRPAFT
jgi:hypothetical protein